MFMSGLQAWVKWLKLLMMLSAIGASLVIRAPNDDSASASAAADIEFHVKDSSSALASQAGQMGCSIDFLFMS